MVGEDENGVSYFATSSASVIDDDLDDDLYEVGEALEKAVKSGSFGGPDAGSNYYAMCKYIADRFDGLIIECMMEDDVDEKGEQIVY